MFHVAWLFDNFETVGVYLDNWTSVLGLYPIALLGARGLEIGYLNVSFFLQQDQTNISIDPGFN